MRINNNIMAMNAHRQLAINQSNASKSMERLSSGLRINRAGDDAAGLAISEKMRGQIRGLKQAMRNAQDGISLLQTAEGALNETHAILQKMRELAVQAANDTNTEIDRNEIQKEINQLTSELNRIGNTTEFNTMKLMNGGLAGVAEASGATLTGGVDYVAGTEEVYTIILEGALAKDETISFDFGSVQYSATVKDSADASTSAAINLDFTNDTPDQADSAAALAASINAFLAENSLGSTWVAEVDGSNNVTITHQDADAAPTFVLSNFTETSTAISGYTHDQGSPATAKVAASGTITFGSNLLAAGTTIKINDHTFALYDSSRGQVAPSGADTTAIDIASFKSNEEIIDALVANSGNVTDVTLSKTAQNVLTITADTEGTAANAYVLQITGPEGQTNAFTANFQIGANKGQSMTIDILDMRSHALGISSLSGTGNTVTIDGKTYEVAWAEKAVTNGTDNVVAESALSVANHKDAAKAVEVIDAAIGKVSAERSKMGSFQNRLEHTISNLGTSAENLQAAESRIRDLDMAEEIMAFTKNNILQQAATAMLAQANMAPQSVLQLLG
jgi:flagellin